MIRAQFAMLPMRFWRGNSLYEILPKADGTGYIGVRDGLTIFEAIDPAEVMSVLLNPQDATKRDTSP